MRVVEVGQYLVTKDTGSLRQFRSVACREYTLPRDDPASEAKGWIQGNVRIGPVLQVTTSFRHFKYGIEIRIWSVNQDNSQSWVRISYGTIKYVVDSNQDNTEIPADPQEERVPQTNIKVVAARSKADKMLLEFAESGHPIFRATTPLSRCNLKSKGHGKLSIHFTADYPIIETVFRISVFANQLSLYGAVANMCEEFESHQDRSGQLDVLMGQSIVLGEIKAEVPLQNENDDSMNDQILWQQYIQRIESLSPESKVSRFCKEAGFMRVVEVGQYFVTKNTGSLRQFRSVACRDYTLPRDDPASEAKGRIQGNMRIGPVLQVTTSFQHFKYEIEIRIWSVNQDNSQSWVRISYGTIKHVVESIQDNTEIPADPQEEHVPQTSIKVVAARSKAKAKPTTECTRWYNSNHTNT